MKQLYEAALTYMISVNTNDVQQSEITFDHICVAWNHLCSSGIMPKVLLMAGACTYLTTVLQLHEACIIVWKEYNHNH